MNQFCIKNKNNNAVQNGQSYYALEHQDWFIERSHMCVIYVILVHAHDTNLLTIFELSAIS